MSAVMLRSIWLGGGFLISTLLVVKGCLWVLMVNVDVSKGLGEVVDDK